MLKIRVIWSHQKVWEADRQRLGTKRRSESREATVTTRATDATATLVAQQCEKSEIMVTIKCET